MPEPTTLETLNALPEPDFMAVLGDLFEHSPWVMAAIAARRPFATARALHDAAMDALRGAPGERRLALVRAHPELAGQEVAAGGLTADSSTEQGRLGFDRLDGAEHAELARVNAAYRARFGFPCIVALCRHGSRGTVLDAMRSRLAADPALELDTAIGEIGAVTEARLVARLGRGRGGLSLHALDTARGGGAVGLGYSLARHEAGGWRVLASGATDAMGRTGPLVAALDMEAGRYRIEYAVGAYHRAQGMRGVAFLDVVPVLFGVADPGAHYHVPLQFTPWSYATYRGS